MYVLNDGLHRLLERTVNEEDVPGVAVAVVHGDVTVATAAAGVADIAEHTTMSVDAACNWFSMTRIATATAAMLLADRGALDPNASPGHYLGDMWPPRLVNVRVCHLLNHSSGLRNPIPIRWVHRAGQPRPDQRGLLRRLLAKQPSPRFQPGARAAYSNVGYLALGEVIATVAACSEETFGSVSNTTLLRPDTIAEMLEVDAPGKPYDLGLGWYRRHDEPGHSVQHLGGGIGFWNVLRVDPQTAPRHRGDEQHDAPLADHRSRQRGNECGGRRVAPIAVGSGSVISHRGAQGVDAPPDSRALTGRGMGRTVGHQAADDQQLRADVDGLVHHTVARNESIATRKASGCSTHG